MSEPVTALKGASFTTGIAQITEVSLQGMITLRGDLASRVVKKAATAVAGVDMPGVGQANCAGDQGICWMSPDEVLVLCPYARVAFNLVQMRETLGDAHALAVNVSDARASFCVSGPHAREVMAKLCPVDLSPGAFAPGMFRRTRMAQVPVAFWMPNSETFQIVCFRSQANYVFDVLQLAAQSGAEMDYFTSTA